MTELDRKILSVVDLHDSSDRAFWKKATPQERLRAVQIQREAAYGRHRANGRVQKGA